MKKLTLPAMAGVTLLAVALGIAIWLACAYSDGKDRQEQFQALSSETLEAGNTPASNSDDKDYLQNLLTHGKPKTETAPEISEIPNHELSALQTKNPDCIGWITVPGTGIDYPLVWTPSDPEKYLYLDFSGDYSDYGVPFLDARCTPASTNLILYGHNKFDGTMFTPVIYFTDPDVLAAHPNIFLELCGEVRKYQVIAAVHTTTESAIYQFTGEADPADFLAAVREEYPALSEIEPSEKQQFITLSTCEISRTNGRALVIGMRVVESE